MKIRITVWNETLANLSLMARNSAGRGRRLSFVLVKPVDIHPEKN